MASDVPGHQPAAACGHDHGIRPATDGAALAHDLVPHGPLPGDDVKIVVRLDQRRPPLLRDALAERLARLAGTIVEHDLRPVAARARDLHRRRIPRHDDDRRYADELGGCRNRLRMVAGGVRHHAPGIRIRIELQQPVAGAPELERAGALQRFRLEQQAPADLLVEGVGVQQRRLDRRVWRGGPRPHAHRPEVGSGSPCVAHGSLRRRIPARSFPPRSGRSTGSGAPPGAVRQRSGKATPSSGLQVSVTVRREPPRVRSRSRLEAVGRRPSCQR